MSDDTVTIDGKSYLKSDIISKCVAIVPLLGGKNISQGDRFYIDCDEYIVARLGHTELQLIQLESGNRFSDNRSEVMNGVAMDLNMFAKAVDRAKRVTKRTMTL